VDELAGEFVEGIRDGTHSQKGWSNSMYGVSKLSEIAYTFCLSKELKDKVRTCQHTLGRSRSARVVLPG
jgi:hypothetical protein